MLKKIAEWALGSDWEDLEMILNECGVNHDERYNQTTKEYIYEIFKGQSDETVESVYGAFVTDPTIGLETGTVRHDEFGDSPIKMFLSHLSADKTIVKAVKDELYQYGISAFVAHEDIHPSAIWREEIELALNRCNAMSVFLSPAVHKSEWIDHETAFAYARGVPIIPLSFGVLPYGIIEKIQAHKISNVPIEPHEKIKVRGDVSKLVEAIIQTLVMNDATRSLAERGFVKALIYSHSFDQTRRLWGMVKDRTSWDDETVQWLEGSLANTQVAKCDPVANEINSLILSERYGDEPF
jgi:hypothetical protein